MNRHAALFIAAFLGAAAAAGGCQCDEDSLDDIIRRIEFYHVGEDTRCSKDAYCKTAACKACTISTDCASGESCMGPFNTDDPARYKLNFGRRTINKQAKESIRISNLTEFDAKVVSIAYKGGSGGKFTLENVPEKIPAKGKAEFTVVYSPVEDKEVEKAVLLIDTKSTTIPHAEVEVYGEGTRSEAILHVDAPDPDKPGETRGYECYDAGVKVYLGFGNVPVGASREITASFLNYGPFTMNVKITPRSGDTDSFRFTDPGQASDGSVSFSVEGGGHGSRDVKMEFNPVNTISKLASYSIEVNDTNCKTENLITMSGRGVTSVIQVCSESRNCPAENPVCNCTTDIVPFIYLSFGDVKVGDKATRKVEIANLGDTGATVKKAALKNPSNNYTLDRTAPPDIPLTGVSEGGGTAVINVTYAPPQATNEENVISIEVETGQGKKEMYEVELRGASQPQICLSPEATLVFNAAPQASETLPLVVTNCGYAKLDLESIELVNDPPSSTSYMWKANPGTFSLESGDSRTMEIKFTNDPGKQNDQGTVYIKSNDPYYDASNPYQILLWSDDNTQDKPPVARIVVTGGSTQEVRIDQLPLRIEIDGSTSSDDKGIAAYEWRMLYRPEDSAASINDISAVKTYFDADKCGNKYTVQLTVTDTVGQVSLPAMVQILVLCKVE
jgi:hypothetical protein